MPLVDLISVVSVLVALQTARVAYSSPIRDSGVSVHYSLLI